MTNTVLADSGISALKFTGFARLRSTILAERCKLNWPAVLTDRKTVDHFKSFYEIFDASVTMYSVNCLMLSQISTHAVYHCR